MKLTPEQFAALGLMIEAIAEERFANMLSYPQAYKFEELAHKAKVEALYVLVNEDDC